MDDGLIMSEIPGGLVAFDALWAERPEDLMNRSVLVKDKKNGGYFYKQIYRQFKSYLRVPGFDDSTGKSYMFSGSLNTEEKFVPLPECLMKLFNHPIRKDSLYDNCVVNWYEPDEYIEKHSDCTAKLKPDSDILIINLNEPGTRPDRSLIVYGKDLDDVKSYPLLDGRTFSMPPGFQKHHKHAVAPGFYRRISITFRRLKYVWES